MQTNVSLPNTVKVLIVEDDILIWRIAATLLTKLGCHAVTATNGKEAVDHVKDKLDVVFIDCQMPVLDGFDATRRWRTLERERGAAVHVPIIALTAEKGEGKKERCLQAGMDDFVSKPLKIEVLREVLNKWTKDKHFDLSLIKILLANGLSGCRELDEGGLSCLFGRLSVKPVF